MSYIQKHSGFVNTGQCFSPGCRQSNRGYAYNPQIYSSFDKSNQHGSVSKEEVDIFGQRRYRRDRYRPRRRRRYPRQPRRRRFPRYPRYRESYDDPYDAFYAGAEARGGGISSGTTIAVIFCLFVAVAGIAALIAALVIQSDIQSRSEVTEAPGATTAAELETSPVDVTAAVTTAGPDDASTPA